MVNSKDGHSWESSINMMDSSVMCFEICKYIAMISVNAASPEISMLMSQEITVQCSSFYSNTRKWILRRPPYSLWHDMLLGLLGTHFKQLTAMEDHRASSVASDAGGSVNHNHVTVTVAIRGTDPDKLLSVIILPVKRCYVADRKSINERVTRSHGRWISIKGKSYQTVQGTIKLIETYLRVRIILIAGIKRSDSSIRVQQRWPTVPH